MFVFFVVNSYAVMILLGEAAFFSKKKREKVSVWRWHALGLYLYRLLIHPYPSGRVMCHGSVGPAAKRVEPCKDGDFGLSLVCSCDYSNLALPLQTAVFY